MNGGEATSAPNPPCTSYVMNSFLFENLSKNFKNNSSSLHFLVFRAKSGSNHALCLDYN